MNRPSKIQVLLVIVQIAQIIAIAYLFLNYADNSHNHLGEYAEDGHDHNTRFGKKYAEDGHDHNTLFGKKYAEDGHDHLLEHAGLLHSHWQYGDDGHDHRQLHSHY